MSKDYIKTLELQNLELAQKNKQLNIQLDELLRKVKELIEENRNIKIEYKKVSEDFKNSS